MEDYIPRSILVFQLEPGQRFCFFGRIMEIAYIAKSSEGDGFRLIMFKELNNQLERGTLRLNAASEITILLNKE